MAKYPEIDDLSNGSKRNQKYIHIHYPGVEEYILSNFNFCKTWIEKLYCYFYRIKSTPKCPVYGSDVQFKSFTAGYHSFCSTSCVSKSESIKSKKRQTCISNYGVEYASRSKTIQSKINNTKRSNDTFNTSKIEEEFASYLDQNHIIYKRQYKSDLYPFNCDFYLPDYELYIEIQGSWTHGHHPYNIELDKETLNTWILKQSKYYNNAIKVWTEKDPLKRETAKLNNLNYLEIFSSKLDIVIIWFQQYITELLNCPNVKQSLVKAYI